MSTMKYHDIKIQQNVLVEIFYGKKTFEVRKNDRDYKVGDILVLHGINDEGDLCDVYTYEIAYILDNDTLKAIVDESVLVNNYVVLGIRRYTHDLPFS